MMMQSELSKITTMFGRNSTVSQLPTAALLSAVNGQRSSVIQNPMEQSHSYIRSSLSMNPFGRDSLTPLVSSTNYRQSIVVNPNNNYDSIPHIRTSMRRNNEYYQTSFYIPSSPLNINNNNNQPSSFVTNTTPFSMTDSFNSQNSMNSIQSMTSIQSNLTPSILTQIHKDHNIINTNNNTNNNDKI